MYHLVHGFPGTIVYFSFPFRRVCCVFAENWHKTTENIAFWQRNRQWYLTNDDLVFGSVAQLVEQRTENPCVGGSIPPLPNVDGTCREA